MLLEEEMVGFPANGELDVLGGTGPSDQMEESGREGTEVGAGEPDALAMLLLKAGAFLEKVLDSLFSPLFPPLPGCWV